MKLPISNFSLWGRGGSSLTTATGAPVTARPTSAIRHPPSAIRNEAAFTLVEIAICLAIISFAILAVIGVLPIGMNTQQDNREETIINQDATMLLEAIRSGSQHADDLVNYVYAITNSNTGVGWDRSYLTTGARIIGLLSTPGPEHYVAYVRSMSGLAADKPPQNNAILLNDSFSYRVVCVNMPVAVDTSTSFGKQLAGCQHELRMTFLWPQLPNGKVGTGRQTFRATIAGQLTTTNASAPALYFYQSQSFTNAP